MLVSTRLVSTRTSVFVRFFAAFGAACLALFLALIVPAAGGASSLMPAFPRNPETRTEVVIIGTRHSAQLEYEDHAPARMRALLNRIDPAAVGVETTPAWFAEEVYYEISYESYGVAVPWAREKGKEVRAIDWQASTLEFIYALSWPNAVPEGVQQTDGEGGPNASASSSASGGEREELPLDLWDMRELLFADTPEWRDAVHREYAFADPDPNPWMEALRRYMLYRNVIIAREIVNLAADYDGQRVVVLIGAAHKPDLDLLLENMPNIVVRHASEWWGDGLSTEEVAAEERRADHLAILWYNLAGSRVEPADVDLARMDALLARLEAEGPFDPEVRFLRAQRHAVAGETGAAVDIYRDLAWETEWIDRSFTYPDRSLAERIADWNAREAEALGFPSQRELSLGNVISPVGHLTIRQRILYELARQEVDREARLRAVRELERAGLNPRQLMELRAQLDVDAVPEE